MLRAGGAVLALCCVGVAWARGAEHPIRPGDSPQAILDAAEAGDTLVFLPGLHEHAPGRHRSILSVDKPIDIELRSGATLRLADGCCRPGTNGEITVDQDSQPGKLDDLEVGGSFVRSTPTTSGPELYGATVYTLVIEKAGDGGAADTFRWGDGKLFDTPNRGVAITGDWQDLSQGVKVRFASRTGHRAGSLWFVSYGGPAAYGIRIGHGTQKDPIENVVVRGLGTIDLNSAHNAQPSGLVRDINACILVHGRVRNVRVEGITMTNTMRSVMCYGEHTGTMLPGGGTEGGESFDAENITIERTRTLNPAGAAYLLGHPSHRGRLRNVICNHNFIETALTAIEPNFNLDGYEVIGNVIKSEGQAIHCWRHSRNGTVADNLRIHDITGKPVVVVNAPRGWQAPEPPVQWNNRNHLADPAVAAASRSPVWSLTFRYGNARPLDAGPRGHCRATFTSAGTVRIESTGRAGSAGPRDLVLFESRSLDRERLDAIAAAAEAALKEPPLTRRGAHEDGSFLRLDRVGDSPTRVFHGQLDRFSDAPPAMLAFIRLVNGLLPENERIPLER